MENSNRVRYEPRTDTWYEKVGNCGYCDVDLFKNEGLNHWGYTTVRRDNTILKTCIDCARYMHARGDLIEIVIIKNGSDYQYEVPSGLNTEEEKKKKKGCIGAIFLATTYHNLPNLR